MICPYCQKEMELGLLQSPHEISWLPGEKRRFFGASQLHQGAVSLASLRVACHSVTNKLMCERAAYACYLKGKICKFKHTVVSALVAVAHNLALCGLTVVAG